MMEIRKRGRLRRRLRIYRKFWILDFGLVFRLKIIFHYNNEVF
jgi:hypothetical protein